MEGGSDNRLDWIDSAKGICIVFVLLSHRCGIPIVGRLVGALYMPLFYIVSGYTQRGVGGEYYRNKIAITIRKYFVYSFILLAVWLIVCIVKSEFSSKDFLRKCIGIVY